MTVTATPIFAQTPIIGSVSLAAQTACTTRAPTATASLAGANIIQFLNTSTNGQRIDAIGVQACSNAITSATAANLVQIWLWDGTNAYLNNEIPVTAITPSATAAAFNTVWVYTPALVLPAAFKLYISVTVTTTASTTALQATAFGGAY